MVRDNNLIKDCAHYFKSNDGFNRMFKLMRKKYKSLGNIGGKIVITNLKTEEKDALSGLMGKDYYNKKSAVISLSLVEKKLSETKYSNVSLKDVMNEYFSEKIVSNKERETLFIEARDRFINKIVKKFQGTKAEKWLRDVLDGNTTLNTRALLYNKYSEEKYKMEIILIWTCKAINSIVSNHIKKKLPVFSAEITTDPHAFDENGSAHIFLIHALCYLFDQKMPKNAEEKAYILYMGNIVKDDISNFTTCNGLIAYSQGRIHRGWQGFFKKNEHMNITLANLSHTDEILSYLGKVFIVENPSVFSHIYAEARKNVPLICTYGQLKLASLVLLDKLYKQNTQMFYSGDFDPEGLLIADRLKYRYGDNLVLWHYSQQDYFKAISSNEVSQRSLEKLKKLKSIELQEASLCLINNKKAAYQEMLIEELVNDILAKH